MSDVDPYFSEDAVSFSCPKSVRACAIRVTKLNGSSVPLDPLTPNSRAQSAAFVELSITPDIETGAETLIKSNLGESIALIDRGCNILKGVTLVLKLCGIPYPMLSLLIGLDGLEEDGFQTGAVLPEGQGADCVPPVMIELWSKNLESCGGWIQWLLPKTFRWNITNSMTFANGSLDIELTGYGQANPAWYPSLPYPGNGFKAYVPGGGDPAGWPVGTAGGVVSPTGIVLDNWTTDDQRKIRGGGPLAWKSVGSLPGPLDDCGYLHTGCEPAIFRDDFCGPAGPVGPPWALLVPDIPGEGVLPDWSYEILAASGSCSLVPSSEKLRIAAVPITQSDCCTVRHVYYTSPIAPVAGPGGGPAWGVASSISASALSSIDNYFSFTCFAYTTSDGGHELYVEFIGGDSNGSYGGYNENVAISADQFGSSVARVDIWWSSSRLAFSITLDSFSIGIFEVSNPSDFINLGNIHYSGIAMAPTQSPVTEFLNECRSGVMPSPTRHVTLVLPPPPPPPNRPVLGYGWTDDPGGDYNLDFTTSPAVGIAFDKVVQLRTYFGLSFPVGFGYSLLWEWSADDSPGSYAALSGPWLYSSPTSDHPMIDCGSLSAPTYFRCKMTWVYGSDVIASVGYLIVLLNPDASFSILRVDYPASITAGVPSSLSSVPSVSASIEWNVAFTNSPVIGNGSVSVIGSVDTSAQLSVMLTSGVSSVPTIINSVWKATVTLPPGYYPNQFPPVTEDFSYFLTSLGAITTASPLMLDVQQPSTGTCDWYVIKASTSLGCFDATIIIDSSWSGTLSTNDLASGDFSVSSGGGINLYQSGLSCYGRLNLLASDVDGLGSVTDGPGELGPQSWEYMTVSGDPYRYIALDGSESDVVVSVTVDNWNDAPHVGFLFGDPGIPDYMVGLFNSDGTLSINGYILSPTFTVASGQVLSLRRSLGHSVCVFYVDGTRIALGPAGDSSTLTRAVGAEINGMVVDGIAEVSHFRVERGIRYDF